MHSLECLPFTTKTQARSAVAERDGDEDDPGDGADGEETLSLSCEVFADEEKLYGLRGSGGHFEPTGEEMRMSLRRLPPVLNDFPRRNDPAFPQKKR
ncbi:hypothetical protein GQ600_12672 [Phytophthora cactorum]|nr:hypothetical protein GQ600_12672 [Phytophthora cactorum]